MANLTPFRYPGAKNKLLSVIDQQLIELGINQQNTFTDAFIGGGSVLLMVAQKYPNIKLFGNDKDYWISSFWKIVASTDTYKLTELLRLMEQPVTLEHFYKLRGELPATDIEAAYRAIFFNRTTFSGIFYSGPIGGKEQKSKYTVNCRWNLKKLKEKINKCHNLLKGRTYIDNLNFNNYHELVNTNDLIYLDPPYFIKGDALYIEKMSKQDHNLLATILNKRQNWLLSYDDHPHIRELYKNFNIIDLAARYCINGEKSSWEHKNELLICSK